MGDLVKGVLVTIATGFIYLVGGFDVPLTTMGLFMLLDYISGVLSAIHNKKLNSNVGFKGILKKASYLLVVIVAHRLDVLLGASGTLRTIVIFFFIANDGISIIENISETGVPIPNKIKEVLEQLKKEND